MTSAAHLAAKLAKRCIDYGCAAEPLDDNCRCQRHRDEHRVRNRGWKQRRARRRADLSTSTKR